MIPDHPYPPLEPVYRAFGQPVTPQVFEFLRRFVESGGRFPEMRVTLAPNLLTHPMAASGSQNEKTR